MINTPWQDYENHLLNVQVTRKRISKLKTMYRVLERAFNKPFSDLSRKDIEAFVTALHRNTFLNENEKPYSGSSKSDIKKFLKQFWKWFKGNDEYYPQEVSWIKTRIGKDEKPKEKPVVTQEQIISVAEKMLKEKYRILTLLLFDSGFRIQEMLSVKKKHLTWEPFDEANNTCFWIECLDSKTLPRKVEIPLFTEHIKRFLQSSYWNNLSDDQLLFPDSYNAYLTVLHRASKSVLGYKLSPHCLRHSSATLYARLYNGDMILLANRYGWSYSAQELRTYVRRSGAMQKRGARKVFENELLKLQQENVSIKKDIEEMKTLIEALRNERQIENKIP
jgi:integrase